MLMPTVSVVIPTYNHARYLPYALDSVIDQNYPNLEVFVIDDGSTDGTAELVKPYRSKINYVYKGNGGTPSALNLGLSLVTGKYVCWLSADDVLIGDKVSKQVGLMERDPSLGFSYTSFVVIDANGVKQYEVNSPYFPNKKEMVKKLMEGCFINGSSVMMRSSALKIIGYFDVNLPQAHDYDLWFRFLRHYSCGFLEEPLLAYRWHGENMSQNPNEACSLIVKERAKRLFPECLN
ncbi:glycosyltransferase [Desulfosporosinus sp. BICA1-9]|uniref:glycosyltransferase n=1 Tax=Desulfosporosinus sp. BICA1-9 TaxID=1531958 RepID=UPI00054BBD0C|nr:glycosyltransferase [Desulfosporosinus sp. BICA1-9]KJS48174.1 MAG: glycosyl transferase family 2 [Peptococcaceae bacterium BRH_c23]KJS89866.1 MAG: glycosyl transferase family 2 [Desulfosporosinus sp. BICA1-9]HBW34989.1 glycosyl transferase family 2 [Desulfosporosinus sp.]